MSETVRLTYVEAIRSAFQYLLANYTEVFTIGQGLWSPWYVGASMANLDVEFGRDRVIDTPVSEAACTGVALGASLCGYRPIMVHPRVDFMLLAVDQMVNQAAKWSYMFGGNVRPAVTFRGIVNRGGEQGAQHSQALHAWFAHIPGLRVVMPASVADARDLLIASVLCDDPVLYIDDRWLYQEQEDVPPVVECPLENEGPKVVREGSDVTLVGSSFSTLLCLRAADILAERGVSAEVVDLRVVNPLDLALIVDLVAKTGRLCAVDGGWRTCGLAGEVIAGVVERLDPRQLKAAPRRVTLPDAPAPTSKPLEDAYYPQPGQIVSAVLQILSSTSR